MRKLLFSLLVIITGFYLAGRVLVTRSGPDWYSGTVRNGVAQPLREGSPYTLLLEENCLFLLKGGEKRTLDCSFFIDDQGSAHVSTGDFDHDGEPEFLLPLGEDEWVDGQILVDAYGNREAHTRLFPDSPDRLYSVHWYNGGREVTDWRALDYGFAIRTFTFTDGAYRLEKEEVPLTEGPLPLALQTWRPIAGAPELSLVRSEELSDLPVSFVALWPISLFESPERAGERGAVATALLPKGDMAAAGRCVKTDAGIMVYVTHSANKAIAGWMPVSEIIAEAAGPIARAPVPVECREWGHEEIITDAPVVMKRPESDDSEDWEWEPLEPGILFYGYALGKDEEGNIIVAVRSHRWGGFWIPFDIPYMKQWHLPDRLAMPVTSKGSDSSKNSNAKESGV